MPAHKRQLEFQEEELPVDPFGGEWPIEPQALDGDNRAVTEAASRSADPTGPRADPPSTDRRHEAPLEIRSRPVARPRLAERVGRAAEMLSRGQRARHFEFGDETLPEETLASAHDAFAPVDTNDLAASVADPGPPAGSHPHELLTEPLPPVTGLRPPVPRTADDVDRAGEGGARAEPGRVHVAGSRRAPSRKRRQTAILVAAAVSLVPVGLLAVSILGAESDGPATSGADRAEAPELREPAVARRHRQPQAARRARRRPRQAETKAAPRPVSVSAPAPETATPVPAPAPTAVPAPGGATAPTEPPAAMPARAGGQEFGFER